MTQNDKVDAAIGTLAAIVRERTQYLRDNDDDPQKLVDALVYINNALYACIDPDYLEKLA